jgi:hypothetical protein
VLCGELMMMMVVVVMMMMMVMMMIAIIVIIINTKNSKKILIISVRGLMCGYAHEALDAMCATRDGWYHALDAM